MNKQDFLRELEDLLQREEKCQENDRLDSYEEWDSLSQMAVMAFFKKEFNIALKLKDLEQVQSVTDLIALSNGNID